MPLLLICQFVNIAFFLWAIYAVLTRKPHLLIVALVWSLAAGNAPFYAGGLLWVPVKVVLLNCVAYCLMHSRDLQRSSRSNGVLVGAGVVLGLSLLASVLIPAGGAVGAKGGQSLRTVIHTYHYLSYLSLIPICRLAYPDLRALAKFVNQYLYASLFCSLVGWVQLAFYAVGLPFVPIVRLGGNVSTVAAFQGSGGKVLRLYAFAGEPKQLAIVLCPALLCCIVLMVIGDAASRRKIRIAMAVIAPIFILTFSTGALAAAAIAIAFLVGLAGWTAPRVVVGVLGSVLVIAAIGTLAAPLLMTGETDFLELLMDRSFGRIIEEREERFEVMVLNYLLAKPECLIAGLGPGMYAYHIRGVLGFGGMGVAQINSGWINLLADLGMIGVLAIFGSIVGLLVRSVRLLNAAPRADELRRALCLASVAGLIGSACTNLGTLSLYSLALWFAIAAVAIDRFANESVAIPPARPR